MQPAAEIAAVHPDLVAINNFRLLRIIMNSINTENAKLSHSGLSTLFMMLNVLKNLAIRMLHCQICTGRNSREFPNDSAI